MENKEMAEKYHINVKTFKYADLLSCEWFVYVNKRSTIYYTNNIIRPSYCKETVLSYILRKLKLKKYITFGKPKSLDTIEPPAEPIFLETKEIPNYKIRFAKTEKNSRDENTQN